MSIFGSCHSDKGSMNKIDFLKILQLDNYSSELCGISSHKPFFEMQLVSGAKFKALKIFAISAANFLPILQPRCYILATEAKWDRLWNGPP